MSDRFRPAGESFTPGPGSRSLNTEGTMEGKPHIKVLLIDDEVKVMEYLSRRLRREGFSIKTTVSGEEALDVVIREAFDVAVVDRTLPGMDGEETRKRLNRLVPSLQCIFLTGQQPGESGLESGRQAAFATLRKPIEYKKLADAIRQAYEKGRSQGQDLRDEVRQNQGIGQGGGGVVGAFRKLRRLYGLNG